jgi:hypothetical protein
LWSGTWFVHDIIPGEYIVTINAVDVNNVSYSVGVGLSVLSEVFSVDNESSKSDENETIIPEEDNINMSSNETVIPVGLNLSLQSDKDVYTVNETVSIHGLVTYNYSLINTSLDLLIISSNYNSSIELDVIDGRFNYELIPDITGTYIVNASVYYSNESVQNEIVFDVTSESIENISNISIVDAKISESVYVVPGTSFYVERTVSGFNNTKAIFAPLYSDSLTIERIEIIDNTIIEGKHMVKETLKYKDYKLGNGVSKSEKKLDEIKEKLKNKMEKLDKAALSDLIVLNQPIKIRIWFKVPSWDEINSDTKSSSGRISYLVFSEMGDDFDFEGSTWWNANWNYRKLITINSSLVDSDLVNFPILVNITDNDLASDAQDDGDDIAFVLWSDNTTKLNHEVELFNGTTGALTAWVNVTYLSGSIDTKIWIYYGNSGSSNQQNPIGVWDSDYVGVWHLNDTGIGTRYDSTSNNNDGTPQNYDGDESTTNGRIAIADNFDGTNDRISITDSSSLSFTNNQLTMEGWVKVDTLPTTEASIVRKENQWAMQFHDINTIRNLVATSGTTGWTAGNDEDYTFITGTWYYWTFVYNGANVVHKLDAKQIGSAHIATGNIVDNGNPAYIAYCVYTDGHIDGIIDEVRISKAARSSDWINASYNTVNNSDNFIIFSVEEQLYPLVSNPFPVNGTTNVAIPPSSFNITINDPSASNMNISWCTNASGSWETFNVTDGDGSGVGNGTYSATNTSWVSFNSTKYWWSVNVSNDLTWTNETFFFTTSYPPQISTPSPANESTSVIKPICSVIISDQDGGNVSVRFYENTTGSWILQQTNNDVDVSSPKTVTWNNYNNASTYETRYWWKVNVTDGKGCYYEEIYNFNTTANNPPVISFEIPLDQSKGISTSLSIVNVTIADPDGNAMDWSIQTSPNIGNNSGNGANNGSIYCGVSGLAVDTTYYWYVNVTDGILSVNETNNFTTNYVPIITLITPSPNGTTNIGVQPLCSIWVNDTEGDVLNVTWATNASGSWVNLYTNNSVIANSTIGYQFTQFDNYSKIYYWSVYVNDSYSNISSWFYFTTVSIDTSINSISPYDINSLPYAINVTGSSNLNNVTLWYRYSSDNSTWSLPVGWWNTSWIYRKSHAISNASGAGTNYQVKIKVVNSSGLDSGDTVYINNKAQSDFDDIRFIRYSDNTTQLDYWIEEINQGINATFWVVIPDDINVSNSTIWIYYGNNSVTNNSNGNNTFIFFDDFSYDLSKWNKRITSGVYPQIENGYLRCGGGSTSSPYGHTVLDSDATYIGFQNGVIDFKYRVTTDAILEFGFRGIWASNQGYKARSDPRSGEGQSFLRPPYSSWAFFGCNQDGNRPSADTWYKGSIIVNGNNFYFYRNDVLMKSCSDSTYITAGSISCQNHYGSYSDFDNICVRKYVNPEPTHGDWSTEEQYLGGQGYNWSIWINISNPDNNTPWSWNFDFPNNTGYYEFYSIGKKSGSVDESVPAIADTICHYTEADTSIDIVPSNWNIGIIGLGDIINTSNFYFNLTNLGNVVLNVQIKGSNATNTTTGAQWELNLTPGFNNYSMQYNKSGGGTWTNINLTYDLFVSNLGVGSWQTFDLKLIMATLSSTTDPLSLNLTFRSIKA